MDTNGHTCGCGAAATFMMKVNPALYRASCDEHLADDMRRMIALDLELHGTDSVRAGHLDVWRAG